MSESDPVAVEIHAFLRQAQRAREEVHEFAWICLQLYRREALAVRTQENVTAARALLRQRLVALLAWASRTGRL